MFFKFKHFPYVRAIHVVKDHELVFKLANKCTADTLFPVGCIFKSFLSVLVGIAIHDGKLHSIHDKIADYYPEHPVSSQWESLTVAHALSNTTGLCWPASDSPVPQTMTDIFSLSFDADPGKSFSYKPDSQLIICLLEQLYNVSITELFTDKIARHYSSFSFIWDKNDIENLQIPIGFLDELGKLYLNKGTLGDTILFDESYYLESVKPYSDGGFPENLAYGLGFWITSYSGHTCMIASGFGGQYLAVIPDKKMVISIFCDMDKTHPEAKQLIELALNEWQ